VVLKKVRAGDRIKERALENQKKADGTKGNPCSERDANGREEKASKYEKKLRELVQNGTEMSLASVSRQIAKIRR